MDENNNNHLLLYLTLQVMGGGVENNKNHLLFVFIHYLRRIFPLYGVVLNFIYATLFHSSKYHQCSRDIFILGGGKISKYNQLI